jgi:8-oxo-dGTP pyrophosphatase MutT (NUDIX family)
MKIASGIGIIYKDLILLARRVELWNGKPIPLGGYWSIFGGTCENKENPIICAIRELQEETEIKIDLHELSYTKPIQNKETIFHVYFAELDYQPSVVLNEEHTEYGWFIIENLNSFPYDIDDKLVDIIQEYKKSKYDI